MAEGDDSDRSWRLFTSKDMIQGYKPKAVRKRKTYANKENVVGNSKNRFTYPLSPFSSLSTGGTPTSTMQPNLDNFSPSLSTVRRKMSNVTRSPLDTMTNVSQVGGTPTSTMQPNLDNFSSSSSTVRRQMSNVTRSPLSTITNVSQVGGTPTSTMQPKLDNFSPSSSTAYGQTGKLDVIISDREVYSLIGYRARDVIPEGAPPAFFPNQLRQFTDKPFTIMLQICDENVKKNIKMYSATNICMGFKLDNTVDSGQTEEQNESTSTCPTETTTSYYHLQGTTDDNLDSSTVTQKQ